MGSRWSAWGGVLAVLVLAGCSSEAGAPEPPDPPEPRTWRPVDLPLTRLDTLSATGDGVIVGGADHDGAPAVVVVRADGTTRTVATRPDTFYGHSTHWWGFTEHQGRLLAFGGDRGGAHGNMRWTVWSESRGTLAEDAQSVETFGGWDAGGLVGLVTDDRGPVLAGSWASDGPGLDIATWHLRGRTWLRDESAGTGLASTPTEQQSVRGATDGAGRPVLVGAVTELGGGEVHMRPALWRYDAHDWSRVLLPAAGLVAEAHAARCDRETCMVTGVVDGRLRLWQVGTAAEELDLPETRLPEGVGALAPEELDGRLVLVVPTNGGSTLLVQDGVGWQRQQGPPGRAVAAASRGGRLYVLTDAGLRVTE